MATRKTTTRRSSAKKTTRKSAKKTAARKTAAKKSSASKTLAQKKVKKVMHERKAGTLRSGKSGQEGDEQEAGDRDRALGSSQGWREGPEEEVIRNAESYRSKPCVQ
jgi:hypothetical protein